MNTRQMITSLLCVLLPAASASAVTLTNRQDVEMRIDRVEICGSHGTTGCNDARYGNAADNFAITGNTCGNRVAARSSCTINVSFTPSESGERSATLRITDSVGTHEVALNGTGQRGGNSGDRDDDHDRPRADRERDGKHDADHERR